MATSGTVVLVLIGSLLGSGIGYSYANSIFTPAETSLRDEVNQLELLLGESERRIDSLNSDLGEADSDLESEKGKVSALSIELDRTNSVIRSLGRELSAGNAELGLERQLVVSTQRALTLSEKILNEIAQSYSLPSEAERKYFDARESARNVEFSSALSELGEAREIFVYVKESLLVRIQQLDELSEISAFHEGSVAINYSSAFSLGVQATITRVDALLLFYTVLEEFETLELPPAIPEIDRWRNLLDQAEILIERGELLIDQARSFSPRPEYIELELIALQDVHGEIISFREFSNL
ncbi:MAG: hypothetical protein V3U49_03390 [Nitrososphaerales archaeon]